MISRNTISIRAELTPRASATSGMADESISGRKMTPMARMLAAPRIAIGSNSSGLTPNTSPNSSEYVSCAYSVLTLMNRAPSPSIRTRASAVATSCRARRPNAPIPRAPATEKTASPTRVLMPSRLAPAAPAKAPFGMAWAANVEPRSTAKKPTTPATTATIVAAIQVFIMKPLNMPPPRNGSGARWCRMRSGRNGTRTGAGTVGAGR